MRIEVVNSSTRTQNLYFQVDYTLEPELPAELGYLHVEFRRENPTVAPARLRHQRGPARARAASSAATSACAVLDHCNWYGEGEVKVYRDGDTDLPTICGTGLEDYVGSAWGMGAHAAPYGGAPLMVERPTGRRRGGGNPDFVGFYRWHIPDPIMFERDLRVTIQQIGAKFFAAGQEAELEAYEQTNPVAGEGWVRDIVPGMLAWGIAERVDDFCSTAYVYCRRAAARSPLDIDAALADIERLPYEKARPMEAMGLALSNDDASAPLAAST